MRRRDDELYMERAVELAIKGMGRTRPNPPVGAVIVKAGKIIGEGYHHRCGGAHAEVLAIRDAIKRGNSPKGAALYVTLEPCSRQGRVGACTQAIIESGIKKVCFACYDPNPKNFDKAKKILTEHGIEVRSEVGREMADSIIRGFAKHQATGLPYVSVKIAMSLDGKICDDYGDARWISSKESREKFGLLRGRVDAIMVGAETIRKDDPSLLCHYKRNNDLIRVIISKSNKLPKGAQVFTDGAPNQTIVYRDVKTAMEDLGKRGITHVLCEGGLKLAVSMAEAGYVDEWISIVAPKIIGKRHIEEAISFRGKDETATFLK